MKMFAAAASLAALFVALPAGALPAAARDMLTLAAAPFADPPAMPGHSSRLFRYASTFRGSSWRRAAAGGDPCAEAVGLVESSIGRSSGFLVGRQHQIVLSTAHGLVDKESGRPQRRATVRFDDSADGPVTLGATVIRVGATSGFATSHAAEDWAILLLDHPAPGIQGLAVRYAEHPADLRRYGADLSLVAYHYDFMSGNRAAISDHCAITDAAGGLVLHDCDAMVGSSGGPILRREGNRCAALAINQGCLGRHRRNLDYAAQGADANANRAIPLADLRDVLEPILRRVEAGAGPRQLLDENGAAY